MIATILKNFWVKTFIFMWKRINFVEITFLSMGAFKIDSAFHPSKVDELSNRNSWGLEGNK